MSSFYIRARGRYEGATRLLALGLLKAVFPQAQARYIAGSTSDWGEGMANCWLSEHHPEVYAVMEADARGKILRTNVMTYFRHLHRIAPGTEDVNVARDAER